MTQRFILHPGDCLEVLDTLDENSIDAVVTDPPYELGFMGKEWDSSGVAFGVETWAKVLRVLKPGGHLIAFGGTRTYHRMTCAIEDAGFEIREMHAWVFGSGFPKSLDVSKAIDKAAGAEREVVGRRRGGVKKGGQFGSDGGANKLCEEQRWHDTTAPATEAAKQWEGWGTATKPAMEPVCLARKPLSEGTVAANVLRWGTGALNIDATRIRTDESLNGGAYAASGKRAPMAGDERSGAALGMFQPGKTADAEYQQPVGRWPANLCHDGSDDVLALFPQTKSGSIALHHKRTTSKTKNTFGERAAPPEQREGDSGSAARFFYQAKASAKDRADSKHPTVKPVALMRQFVRLVTPPGGTVLDPFAGSGTTGQAAIEEGFNAVLIEREDEYRADILRRMNAVLAECDPDYPF